MARSWRPPVLSWLGIVLCLFTLGEVNYPWLSPQTELALFSMAGLVLCFMIYPVRPRWLGAAAGRLSDLSLALLTVAVWGYVVIQTEPALSRFWSGGQSLGNRAGQETALDLVAGGIGLLLVLEAARRAIGPALPLLSLAFILYARVGVFLPGWLLPHRGYPLERIASQAFLQSQGVFGVALRVMFTYVFLFVLFGAVLERSGATAFIIHLARRLFQGRAGGSAKVAVLSSGLMGSLSGSAVANTATTGTFTIPMMRNAGFPAVTAAAIEAAASSGGALVPPVMGAGAYMMLEIVEPQVTYLQIIQAALIPAILYYFSLLLMVHFQARMLQAARPQPREGAPPLHPSEGAVFLASFTTLLGALILGYTAFRAVSFALIAAILASLPASRTRLAFRDLARAGAKAARDMVPLVAAAACVGIIIGIVTLTGVGTRLPELLLPLARENLPLALAAIMASSLILGMGLPSAVCYLLLATLIGPALAHLGVVPLSAHLFIFYFGMMSMVTPPVALAAYAAGSIAGSPIMRTGLTAFRFALAGFILPYFFVLRPQLLWLDPGGGAAAWSAILATTLLAGGGIVAFTAGLAGRLFAPLSRLSRAGLLLAAGLFLFPGPWIGPAGWNVPLLELAGGTLLTLIAILNRRSRPPAG